MFKACAANTPKVAARKQTNASRFAHPRSRLASKTLAACSAVMIKVIFVLIVMLFKLLLAKVLANIVPNLSLVSMSCVPFMSIECTNIVPNF